MSNNEIIKSNNGASMDNGDAVNQLAAMLISRMSATVDESINNAIAEPISELKDDQKKINERLDKIEDGTTIESREQGAIQICVSERIHALLADSTPEEWGKYSRTFFSRCQSSIRRRFCVPSYRDIRKVDFQLARDIINDWEPQGGVQALKDWIDEREKGDAPDEAEK